MLKKILFALLFANIGAFISTLKKDAEILKLQKRIAHLTDPKALRVLYMKGYKAGYERHEVVYGVKLLERYANRY